METADNSHINMADTYRPSVFYDIIKDTQRPLFVLCGSAGGLERMNYSSPVTAVSVKQINQTL